MFRIILAASLSWIFATSVFAHGSMEVPISRVYNCYKEGPENVISDACKAFVAISGKQPLYDWDMVNQAQANDNHIPVVPDGTLCAGGQTKYAGLDLPRPDWVTTTIKPDSNGKFNFVFRATVPHATKYFKLYFSNDNYDFTRPLKWSDLDEPFCTMTSVTLENGRYNFNCTLPKKSGRRILYSVWQRSDSGEAFYSCSDMILANDVPIQWKALSNFTAQTSVKENSKIVFWLMKNCKEIETYTIQLLAGQTNADQWPFVVAQAINAKSSLVHVGQLNMQTGEVVPVQSATENKVYIKDTDTTPYFYIVDFLEPGQLNPTLHSEGRMKYCMQNK